MDKAKASSVDKVLTGVLLGLIVLAVWLFDGSGIFCFLLISATVLTALFFVIKYAVKSALREHDAEKYGTEQVDGAAKH